MLSFFLPTKKILLGEKRNYIVSLILKRKKADIKVLNHEKIEVTDKLRKKYLKSK